MILIDNVNKRYSETSGNFDINIKVDDGEVYGIIGPNGAGKTTLIRQILGFIKSDEGSVTIDNFNSWSNRQDIMDFTGYIAGEVTMFSNLKGKTYLDMVFKYKKDADRDYLNDLIEYFEIDVNKKIKKMSKGMKQKIAIIAAVVHKPKFLVLDEPTSGLDPVMQIQFNDLIRKMKDKYGTTIIICSHIFEEVANLADRVGFIKDGRLVEEYKIVNRDTKELNERFQKLFTKKSVI